MAGQNEFLPFASNIAANVMSQAEYAAAFTGGGFGQVGFSAGVAISAQLNKVWRQSAAMTAAIGGFISTEGFNALDDADIDALSESFKNAILAANRANPCYAEDSGTANTLVAALTPAPQIPLAQDFTVDIKIAVTNTGATTLNLNSSGAVNVTRQGAPLTGGELVAGQIATFKRDITGNSWQLTSAVTSAPTVLTADAPTTGSANAQVIASASPGAWALVYGYIINFTAGYSNTGSMTLDVESTGAITVKKGSSGALVNLVSGDIVSGSSYSASWNGTNYVLIPPTFDPANFLQKANNLSDLASATTARTNLGLGSSAVLNVNTSVTLAGNSDTLIPSQKAVKTYVDNSIVYAITGFVPSGMTGSASTAAMNFSAGRVVDNTGAGVIVSPSTLPWSVTTDYQGATSLPGDQTINFFVVKGSSGVKMWATTAATPTAPAGYTDSYQYVFSLRTFNNGSLFPFSAMEISGGALHVTRISNEVFDFVGETTATWRNLGTSVPIGRKMQVNLSCSIVRGSGSQPYTLFTDPDGSPNLPFEGHMNAGFADSSSNTSNIGSQMICITNALGQVRLRSASGGSLIYFTTESWVDFRRG